MRVVYLAHPYGGNEANAEGAKQIVRQLVKKFPGTVFLSPLQATGFYYNDIPYLDGMEHCLELLSRCDELWLCDGWQDSKGCCMEYAAAKVAWKSIFSISDDLNLFPIFVAPNDFGRMM
jgi:hypothetical protein